MYVSSVLEIQMAHWFKAYVFGRLIAISAGSKPAEGMDVLL